MATFTDATKHSVTVTNQSANSVTPTTSRRTDYTYYLMTEAGDYITTEDGKRIICEQTAPGRTYTNLAKS